MGWTARLGKFLIAIGFIFFLPPSQARNQCADDIKISSLPREMLPGVESINSDRESELALYNKGNSVIGQVRQPGVFGYYAVIEDEIVGFAVVERRSNYFTILDIAVAKGRERQGIGRGLVGHIFEEASHPGQGIDEIRTLVSYNDQNSRAFFGGLEFAETEVIPGKFERGTRSGVMLKKMVRDRKREDEELKRQLQPAPQRQKVVVAVEVIDIPMSELRKLDPTLEHATDID